MVEGTKSTERPSSEVSRVAAAAGLGGHVATWAGRYSRETVTAGVLLCGGGVYSAVMAITSEGLGWWVWFALMAVLVIGAGLWMLDPRVGRVRVYGFAGGIVRRDRRGRLSAVGWGDIADMGWRESSRSGEKAFLVKPRGGSRWVAWPSYFQPGHVSAMAEFVERQMAQRRPPHGERS
ncbi:MAG: hypothetical protein ACRDQ0_13970 [Pseudonocardia sp.]